MKNKDMAQGQRDVEIINIIFFEITINAGKLQMKTPLTQPLSHSVNQQGGEGCLKAASCSAWAQKRRIMPQWFKHELNVNQQSHILLFYCSIFFFPLGSSMRNFDSRKWFGFYYRNSQHRHFFCREHICNFSQLCIWVSQRSRTFLHYLDFGGSLCVGYTCPVPQRGFVWAKLF